MLKIYILGNFRVERDGITIPADAWARRKTRSLLKLLALQPGHRLHKEQAMEMLWPDLDPIAARDNFYRNLSFLRHILEPDLQRPADSHYLTLAAETLELGPPQDIWIDADAFVKYLAQVRTTDEPAHLLESALDLYTGDLLPEDAYEEWTLNSREALRRAATEALLQLAETYTRDADYEAAITALQRLLTLEPTDEQAHRRLMLTYMLAGRRHDALRQYEHCIRILNTELGLEPEPETISLHTRILKGEITSSAQPIILPQRASRPNNLPEPGTPLIGRELELLEAGQRLLRPDVRLLTLTGPAGIGKTRLGLQIANNVQDSFADGVYFVPLAPIRAPELALSAIAQALGHKEGGDLPLLETLKSYLRDKHLLLLLDNFEQVVGAAPLLAQLLTAAPHVKMLVTSRELLRLSAEHDFPVSPLALPDQAQPPLPERLSICASVQLFTARAGAVKPGFEMTAENAPAISEICHRLDGIPLAIELAAARIRILTPQALLSRLSSRLRLLTGGPRDLPARQQTLYNAIDWSYELLSSEEQTLFARLSVFSAGCTEEAAETVCGAELGQATFDILALLLDKSLLRQVDASGGEARFMMLETIREYASERLAERDEVVTIQSRHAEYYVRLAEAGEAAWFTAAQHYWLERFDEELYNFRSALAWTLEHEPILALRLSGALWRYWLAHGFLTEGRRLLEEALVLIPRQNDGAIVSDKVTRTARTKALFAAGVLTTHQADYPHANQLIAQSLGMARASGDMEQVANSLIALSIVANYRGDYAQALVLLEESLPITRDLGYTRGSALVLNSLSNAVFNQGDYKRAAALAEESLKLSRSTGDSLSIAAALTNLGHAMLELGDTEAAAGFLEESLALRRKLKDKGGIAHTLNFLGHAALTINDTARAADFFSQSLSLRHEMGDREGVAAPLEGLAAVAGRTHQYSRAARLFGAAETLREAIGAPQSPTDRAHWEQIVASIMPHVNEQEWSAEWSAGRLLSVEQAVDYALELVD